MRVGKKLFPYPVINNSEKVSSFKDSSFSLVYEDASDDEFLILKDAHLVIDDLKIKRLTNAQERYLYWFLGITGKSQPYILLQ